MSWEMIYLNNICRPRQWKTLSLDKLDKEGYPVYGANGKIGFYKEFTHELPTLTITCRGATCGTVHITEPKSYINGNAMALDDLSNDVDIKFLFYYFQYRGFIDVISGSAQPQITGEGLSQVQIPLPPLPIQQRIAEILDAADALRRKDDELLRKYDELAQAIFIDMFGDPVKNEKGWERKKMSAILDKIESGWSPICLNRSTTSNEWGVLKLGSVTKCIYDDSENKALPQEESPRVTLEVKKGDVLFSRKNTSNLVAACVLVNKTRPKLMISDLIFRLKINKASDINPTYFHNLLVFPTKRAFIQSLAGGAAGSMPNISKEKLMTVEIEFPPIEIQNSFEEKIHIIETLKEKVIENNSEHLFNSLLQQAFKGELVK